MLKISLAAARVNAGKTQENVAKELMISKATLVKWESGKSIPRADKLQKMSELYDMPIENLKF